MQVNSWPENPLDRMISFCEQFAVRSTSSKVEIGDFGCGEARLAATLQSNSRTRSRVNMHSFDLVAGNEFITACDIRHTPLAAQSLDIAIFCLSLMGTNFQEFLLEAQRVLKIGYANTINFSILFIHSLWFVSLTEVIC
jgi:ribosomal RNA-processing protein 8